VNNGRRLPNLPIRPTPGVPDSEFLARWVEYRDEAAFELLVRRHAATVLGACRRLLADPNDADDAFQATFFVLARKAASVARGEAMAAWLHRVAYRAALRIRADRQKRCERQSADGVTHIPAPDPPDPDWADWLRVLDEEVERLPAHHRAAFVLCCLEGRTGEEAARLLGCPPGTVSSRLTRARERLRARLVRRGFGAAALALAALPRPGLAVAAPNALVESVARAALPFAAGLSLGGPPARPITVAEGVLRAMLVYKLRFVPALFAFGLLATGIVLAGSGPEENAEGAPTPRPTNVAAAGDPPVAPPPNPIVQPLAPPVTVVTVVKPRQGGRDRIVSYSYNAEALVTARLHPAVAGTLTVPGSPRIGDRVKAGQLLAQIDAPGLAIDERAATTGVDQAEGLLKEAEARVAATKAQVAAARGLIRQAQAQQASAQSSAEIRKRQYESTKKEFASGAISTTHLNEQEDRFRAAEGAAAVAGVAVENAKADLAAQEVKVVLAEAGVATARANVEAAKLGLEKARLNVAQARVVAPFDGVLAFTNAAPLQAVRPPGDRADAQPLFTIMRTETLRLLGEIPEALAWAVKPGMPAEAQDPQFRSTATGTVAAVGVTVDPGSGMVRVEIDVPNPQGELRPGMRGWLSINLGKGPAGALRVPNGAVFSLVSPDVGGRVTPHVYVYKDGKARAVRVETGFYHHDEVEVLSGLKPDDQVVTDPGSLSPRAEVAVQIEKAAPPK
jgi:RND family efflux transporter MFP subunit